MLVVLTSHSPGRGAFPNATTNASDPGLLGTLAYHVVSGSFNDATQTYPKTTIGRTALNASNLVQLEGNKAQVLAWARFSPDNKIRILNQKCVLPFLSDRHAQHADACL